LHGVSMMLKCGIVEWRVTRQRRLRRYPRNGAAATRAVATKVASSAARRIAPPSFRNIRRPLFERSAVPGCCRAAAADSAEAPERQRFCVDGGYGARLLRSRAARLCCQTRASIEEDAAYTSEEAWQQEIAHDGGAAIRKRILYAYLFC